MHRWTRRIGSLLIAIPLLAPAAAHAHGGGLDGSGGHYNRKTGQYHCHRCPCGCSSTTKEKPETPMRDREKSPPSPGALNNPGSRSGSATTTASSLRDYSAAVFTEKRVVRIARVIDGDTLETADGERIRLIGVDTPETVHPTKPVERFGREASAFTKQRVEGRMVTLMFDQERVDRYGRTLAYVFTSLCDPCTDAPLNEQIIAAGYGHAYTEYPFRGDYMDRFRAAERAAREGGSGLWGE